jgi:hypothetical protein
MRRPSRLIAVATSRGWFFATQSCVAINRPPSRWNTVAIVSSGPGSSITPTTRPRYPAIRRSRSRTGPPGDSARASASFTRNSCASGVASSGSRSARRRTPSARRNPGLARLPHGSTDRSSPPGPDVNYTRGTGECTWYVLLYLKAQEHDFAARR